MFSMCPLNVTKIWQKNILGKLVIGICCFAIPLLLLTELLCPNNDGAREIAREDICIPHLRWIHNWLITEKQDAGKFPCSVFVDTHDNKQSWRYSYIKKYIESSSSVISVHYNWSVPKPWLDEFNREEVTFPRLICSTGQQHQSDTSYLMLLRGHPIDQLPDTAVIVVESADNGIHWMEPRDLDIQILLDSDTPFGVDKLNSYHDGYVNALRKNGEVVQISKNWNKEQGVCDWLQYPFHVELV